MSMCSTIMCELGPMAARDTVLISIKSTVAMKTVIQVVYKLCMLCITFKQALICETQ